MNNVMYRALAIRDFKIGEPFQWRDSYFLIGHDNIEETIRGAIAERQGRGGKYGAVIFSPTGYEEGFVESWSEEGFISREQVAARKTGLEFNSGVKFPAFWFESQNNWGQVGRVYDLTEAIRIFCEHEGIKVTRENSIKVLKMCKNAAFMLYDIEDKEIGYGHDLTNFGTRREHQHGTTTLWDHLITHNVINPID